ncbi:MAG: hypothetical protein AAFU38_20485 [Bacteroidota bacterium]
MRFLFLALLVPFGAAPLAAQHVSLHGGSAQHFSYGASGGVADLEVGLPLLSLGPEDAFSFSIGAYGGQALYPGYATATSCAGCVRTSLRHVYVGARLGVQFDRMLLPVRFTVGVARYHERTRREVTPASPFVGEATAETFEGTATYSALDLGARLLIPVVPAWALETGASSSLPFDEDRAFGPLALTLGVRWGR